MSVEWLNRNLFMSPYYIGLCLSEKDYRAALRKLKVKPEHQDEWNKSGNHATTHHFESPTSGLCAVVTIDPANGKTGCQIAALLCHEAVHIFQYSMRHVGEHTPSDEFMAYAIQNIAQALMESYVSQTSKHRSRP